jgi:ribose 5-phosphate isomerase B
MVFLGADHAGFARKERVKTWLLAHGYPVDDLGAATPDPTDDFPLVAKEVGEAVVAQGKPGVLLCGNAEGMCMAANKIPGVRAALGYTPTAVAEARREDDANVLCLPGRHLDEHAIEAMLHLFLTTPFSGEPRYKRRIQELHDLDKTQLP